MRKKRIEFIVFLLIISFGLAKGCATQEPSLKLEKSLPQDKLASYNDSFDKLREHLWELSQLTYNKAQTANFKLADVRVEDGKFKVKTKIGGFSKGGLITKYEFRGDFDIQIDCDFDFSQTISGMDQRLIFAVTEKNKKLADSYQAIIQLLKESGSDEGLLKSVVLKYGKYQGGVRKEREIFHGTIRFVRSGGRISMFHKPAGSIEWIALYTSFFTKRDVIFGFALQNFTFKRRSIKAGKSISATFDNFRINAAQQIVESEI
jgi:hypothetical protein